MADLLKRMESMLEKKKTQRRPHRDNVQVKCYFCKEMDHYTNKCPSKQGAAGRPGTQDFGKIVGFHFRAETEPEES